MVSSHMNENRKLIPEFYFASTFLENANHFDLGLMSKVLMNSAILLKSCRTYMDSAYLCQNAFDELLMRDDPVLIEITVTQPGISGATNRSCLN
jgi:hypothetical protein